MGGCKGVVGLYEIMGGECDVEVSKGQRCLGAGERDVTGLKGWGR